MTSTLPTTWRPLTLRVWPWKLRISSPVWKYTKWQQPLVLRNILVVKDLYESFAYSLTIERTRNSITARGHNLRSYTVILWLITENENFFCAYVITHLKTLKEQLENGLMVLRNTNSPCLQDFAFMETHLFLFLKLYSTTLAMTYAQIVSLYVHVSGSTIQDIIHDLQWNTKMSKG